MNKFLKISIQDFGSEVQFRSPPFQTSNRVSFTEMTENII